MSTSFNIFKAPTFEEIDASFVAGAAYMERERTVRAFRMTRDDLIARVVKYYGFARPFLVVMSMSALVRESWRIGMQGLIVSADALAAAETPTDSTTPDFKAGKDL
jgi:hypothetical protein